MSIVKITQNANLVKKDGNVFTDTKDNELMMEVPRPENRFDGRSESNELERRDYTIDELKDGIDGEGNGSRV